jgi:[ribosomal protein S5]-alanine N-acetyltransferase
VHRDDGPIGVTGLSEVARRDRRCTVGTWLGHQWWGSGANFESKALITALAFRRLGMHRLTAWASTRNGRSQAALERIGFSREGVLAAWHRHGEAYHDVVVFSLLREGWERTALPAVDVQIDGTPPAAFALDD